MKVVGERMEDIMGLQMMRLDIIKRSNWRVKSEKRVGKNLEPEKRQGRMRTQPGTEYIARMGNTVLVASVHHLYPPLLEVGGQPIRVNR